jgi:hypothetical protein
LINVFKAAWGQLAEYLGVNKAKQSCYADSCSVPNCNRILWTGIVKQFLSAVVTKAATPTADYEVEANA